jgi:phospholipase C
LTATFLVLTFLAAGASLAAGLTAELTAGLAAALGVAADFLRATFTAGLVLGAEASGLVASAGALGSCVFMVIPMNDVNHLYH